MKLARPTRGDSGNRSKNVKEKDIAYEELQKNHTKLVAKVSLSEYQYEQAIVNLKKQILVLDNENSNLIS